LTKSDPLSSYRYFWSKFTNNMFKLRLAFTTALLFSVLFSQAIDGMWIPTLLNKYNIEEMKKMGFRLTAEDIYNINKASMKDAVILFGSGCTGELVSGEGLFITNYHCGYSMVQSHSSLQHDYLTNGFWAKNRQEELTNPGLTVRILKHMDDVTSEVMAGTANQPADSVKAIINRNSKKISDKAAENGKYDASVQPLFYGNQYFLYVYDIFSDIRLVGAPPSSVGKFGGDTDNWIWPRHTGDFTYFRIYAGKNNQPAKYSPDNVPFKSKKFFKISMKGVKENDFTMVFGYPGKTQEFVPSEAIEQIMKQGDPDKIKIRDIKLAFLSTDMDKDPAVRLEYAAKYARTSNAWKKWQGEIKGLKRLNVIENKQRFEAEFKAWVDNNAERTQKYGEILSTLEKLYKQMAPYTKANDYYTEIVQNGTDIFNLVSLFKSIGSQWDKASESERLKIRQSARQLTENYFNSTNLPTDEKIFAALLKLYAENVDPAFLPDDFRTLMKKHDQETLISKVYSKSLFSNHLKLAEITHDLNAKKIKMLTRDPVFIIYQSLKKHYESVVEPTFTSLQNQIDAAMKTYMAGIMEMKQGERIWPDANKTLRVAYGKVEGFQPMDGVTYDYFSTIDGIMQKDNPNIYDYNVPQKLRDLYRQKDYGRYGKNGQLYVCFVASNHTTGGNSGSPVIDANGDLIGVNFDRCWEGTMSDLIFDPDRCRNIVLDIRYALFITDKLAGAGYLIDEMSLVE
jgi:hypothetical protein